MTGSGRASAESPVLVVSTAGRDLHETGRHHPESRDRLAATELGIGDAARTGRILRHDPRPATLDELRRVHDDDHLRALRHFVEAGGGNLDPDTVASPGSWPTALDAAGAALVAVRGLQGGEAAAAFVAVRPPGHHASRDRASGFCLLNNVAVAAAALVAEGERVLVVDWDVHHGNGTQAIFWDDPSVMYVSTHQWPAYPGTGRAGETGGAGAPGSVLNFPLPPGATGDVARAALDDVVAPAVSAFSPTWVLVSAGFDAHRDDPLAELAWSAGDYVELARRVVGYAPGPGRVVALLEGGYDLAALRRCVAATIGALAGGQPDTEPPTAGGPGLEAVAATARARERATSGPGG